MKRTERSGKLSEVGPGSIFLIRFLIVFSLGVFLGSGAAYAKRPPKGPKLDSTLCIELGGVWTDDLCAIGEGSHGHASFDLLIPEDVALVIRGSGVPPEFGELPCNFVIEFEVTIENEGLISVENSGSIGFCNLGKLINRGTINVANTGAVDTSYGLENFAEIANYGNINVLNGGRYTIGIINLPHIPESFWPYAFQTILPTISNSGNITIQNNGDHSFGIVNYGAFSNGGTITVQGNIIGDYGLLNLGTLTIEVSGLLENFYGDTSLVPPTYPAGNGVVNFEGTMINYGTVTNEGVIGSKSWAVLTYGTLDNRGVIFQSGGPLVNYGKVNNWGVIDGDGTLDSLYNAGVCTDLDNADGTMGSGCDD